LRFAIFNCFKIATWQLAIENGFGYLELVLEIYLGFGDWNLI